MSFLTDFIKLIEQEIDFRAGFIHALVIDQAGVARRLASQRAACYGPICDSDTMGSPGLLPGAGPPGEA